MSKKGVILCVDDENIVLNSLRAMLLRNLGQDFELEFAESGAEALEIVEDLDAQQVTLYAVITDWLMPEMKGDELLSRLRGRKQGLRTIMLSGQADKDAIHHARMQAELDYFISKPWDESDLITKLTA